MAYENKPGDFALFKNDKGDNAKRPDYKGGGLDLDGNEVEIACWIKEGKKGKFMSCKMKLANEKQTKDKPKEEDDSRIPF